MKLVLSTSGSWHVAKTSCQENGCSCGWGWGWSSPHLCWLHAGLPYGCARLGFLDPSREAVRFPVNDGSIRPVDEMVFLSRMVSEGGFIVLCEAGGTLTPGKSSVGFSCVSSPCLFASKRTLEALVSLHILVPKLMGSTRYKRVTCTCLEIICS